MSGGIESVGLRPTPREPCLTTSLSEVKRATSVDSSNPTLPCVSPGPAHLAHTESPPM